MIKKYRKKPVAIEAIQLQPLNMAEVEKFVGGDLATHPGGGVVIATLEGPMWASLYDYIIKGIKGEFYPCRADTFEATYEEVTK